MMKKRKFSRCGEYESVITFHEKRASADSRSRHSQVQGIFYSNSLPKQKSMSLLWNLIFLVDFSAKVNFFHSSNSLKTTIRSDICTIRQSPVMNYLWNYLPFGNENCGEKGEFFSRWPLNFPPFSFDREKNFHFFPGRMMFFTFSPFSFALYDSRELFFDRVIDHKSNW